jgi:hypothetical protein
VKKIPCDNFYNTVANIYSWRQVAERTEKVYDFVMDQPVPNIMARIKSSFSWGPVVGLFSLLFTIIEAITLCITEKLFPESNIDIARNFDSKTYGQCPKAYGNHEVYVDTQNVRHKTKQAKKVDFKHEEIEILSESYLLIIDHLTNRAQLLDNAIDDTEDLVTIRLDTIRNRILFVELTLNILGLAFAAGILVAGIFGIHFPP